jgi:hypothetical protein
MRRAWREYQWYVIGVLWVVVFTLGFIGLRINFSEIGVSRTFWDTVNRTLQLFVLESGIFYGPANIPLEIARFLAPLVALFTAIQAFVTIFYKQLQRAGLRFARDHVVICGLGRKGLILAREFHLLGYRVVVLEQDEKNSRLEQCMEQGIVTLIGKAADIELLRRAGVRKAIYVISVCGDDGANAEVAVNTRHLATGGRGRALTCFIHIGDLDLRNLLREQEIYGGEAGLFRLELFNVFESGARALLDEFPVSGVSGAAGDREKHALVVGLGRMGRSLVVHAAWIWEAEQSATGQRLRVSLVDRNAASIAESLAIQYPWIGSACDIHPVQMDVESPEFQQAEFLSSDGRSPDVTAIYVCLDDDSRALSAALTLLQKTRSYQIPIVVRMVQDAGLASLLGTDKGSMEYGFADLHPFGLLDRTCKPDLLLGTHELLARAIHEEYLRSHVKEDATPETNPSLVPWDELPEDLRESNLRQADHIGVKLKAIRCSLERLSGRAVNTCELAPEDVELLAQMEHQRWREEREGMGYVFATGPKDLQKKTSPLLVPWVDLPDLEKEKLRENIRKMPVFLAKAGFQMVRIEQQQ